MIAVHVTDWPLPLCFCHCSVTVPPPVAVAFKLAVCPEMATTLNGCTVNTGRLSTLTVVTVLVTVPPAPLTRTLYTPACAAPTPLNA